MLNSLASAHKDIALKCIHTDTYTHGLYVKAATHVVSNLVGTEGPIRQTAQREVAPVMWNGSH